MGSVGSAGSPISAVRTDQQTGLFNDAFRLQPEAPGRGKAQHDKPRICRILGLALVLVGHPPGEAASLNCMGRKTPIP